MTPAVAAPTTEKNPLQVAVVGAGPSGFYAAEALIKSDCPVQVDVIERLPAPYGLVRNGVAPDHPKLKQAIGVYDKIAHNPEFRYIGNVTVGRDLDAEELRQTHHAVIYTCGAETDRKLGIPGEHLPGSHTATELVGWYNGHPDYRDRVFDFSHETAVIIGQGNVAADAARILAKSVDELKNTDIAEHALAALAESRIREIHVVGRRGPAQVKFTSKELREFLAIENCSARVAAEELALNPQSQSEIEDKAGAMGKKNYAILRQFADADAGVAKPRTCRFTFLKSPLRLEGGARLARVVLEHNRLEGEPFRQSARATGATSALACGLLFRSIGYRGVPIAGVPFDDRSGTFPNRAGRVTEGKDGGVVPGVYTAGWIKRGPSGIIGTNRACAVETVKALLEDAAALRAHAKPHAKPGAARLLEILDERGVEHVDYARWKEIDAAEIARGALKQKPREKFTRVGEMLAATH